MENGTVRLLRAEEIECRTAAINEKGLSLILYKDARVDQRILDEAFGVFGWKRSHQCIDGNLYCTVEVKDRETGEWVAKQDVGTTGYAEKEKSQASDSFKRACFNWGIGRELYSAPFIWIPASRVQIQKKGDRHCCSERFSVLDIAYNSLREITGLTISNAAGCPVFTWKSKTTEHQKTDTPALSAKQQTSLEAELRRTGVGMEAVRERYHIKEDTAHLPEELYEKIMKALAKTKSAEAA